MLMRARFPVDIGHVLLVIGSDMRPTVIHYARGEGCLGVVAWELIKAEKALTGFCLEIIKD